MYSTSHGRACGELGLTISLKKTVVMCLTCTRKNLPPQLPSIYANSKKLEIVDTFLYLESTLSINNTLDKEISV